MGGTEAYLLTGTLADEDAAQARLREHGNREARTKRTGIRQKAV